MTLTIKNKIIEDDLHKIIPSSYFESENIKEQLQLLRSIRDDYIDKGSESKNKSNYYHSKASRYEDIILSIENDPRNWLIKTDPDLGKIKFQPIFGAEYVNTFFFNYANEILFMSGTIPNKKEFISNLGLNITHTKFKSYPTPFNKINRPIYIGNLDLSYNKQETNLVTSIKQINSILKNHHKQKGIIHVSSYSLINKIKDKYTFGESNRIQIVTKSHKEKNKILKEYKDSKNNNVLISTSLYEGVDLPDDDCRFQIIYNLPYLNMNDPQVKKRKELDKIYGTGSWYDNSMIVKLLQAYGRIMRNEKDYGVTYILDKRILNKFSLLKNQAPYFVDAYNHRLPIDHFINKEDNQICSN